MKLSNFFRPWWMILIQGILLIVLSAFIFNNPQTVITALAFWFGFMVFVTGLIGIISYFINKKVGEDLYSLLGGGAITIIGILMMLRIVATIKAITFIFGLLVSVVGLLLIIRSLNIRKQWSYWWIISVFGIAALATGVKSIMNVYSGAASISAIIGFSVLFSGIGMVSLAILKKQLQTAITE